MTDERIIRNLASASLTEFPSQPDDVLQGLRWVLSRANMLSWLSAFDTQGGTALSNASGSLPPAGWYPDPYGAPFERWWDGAQWTLHTNEGQPPAATAPPQQPVQQPTQQPEPLSWQPQAAQQPEQQPEPLSWQPQAAQQPVQQPTQPPEQAPYTPPALEYPNPVAPQQSTAPVDESPFAGFASPSTTTGGGTGNGFDSTPASGAPTGGAPASYNLAAAFEASPDETSPFGTPAPASQVPAFGADPQSSAAAYTPASAGTDDPFDFGFGAPAASASPQGTPAQGAAPVFSAPATDDSGLFSSWEPEEYEEPPANGPATASLVLGILSFFLSALAGLIGIILGVVGLAKAARLDREGEGPVGRGKAIGGIITSVIGSAVAAAILVYAIPLVLPTTSGDATGTGGTDTADTSNLTANGGIPLEVGTAGVINFPDSEKPAVQFTVTDITRDPTCTADPTQVLSPENGQFVAVTMTFVLDPDYLSIMTSGGNMRVSTDSWIGFLDDKSQVISTDAGNSCNPEEEQIPDLTPGTTVSGTIVLDLTAQTTAVSWSPSDVTSVDPGITRWEWALPAS
jgi:hypothetical protein